MGKAWPALMAAVGPDRLPSGPGAEEFGCGHYGCVWPTASGQVVKITSDATEAAFVAAYLRMGWVPGMVRYYQIVSLPGISHRKRPVFVIWRAEAWDVGVLAGLSGRFGAGLGDPHEQRMARKATMYLESFQLHAALIRDYLKARQNRSGDAAQVAEEAWKIHGESQYWDIGQRLELRERGPYSGPVKFDKHVSAGFKGAGKVAIHIAACSNLAVEMSTSVELMGDVGAALDNCLDRGILLCDVHAQNVGRIEYDPENWPGDLQWGITDPGHALFLSPEWASLRVPSLVASNPWSGCA